VCGPAGVVVYSCSDLTKPCFPPITRFGGVSCATLLGNTLVFVGRPCVREVQAQQALMDVTPNLSAWRSCSLTSDGDHSGYSAEEEDEDLVRNHGSRSVRFLDLPSGKLFAELYMKSAFCAVGFNYFHVVVVLEDCTYVYNFSDITDTLKNLHYRPDMDEAYSPVVNRDGEFGCKPVAVIQTPLNYNGVFALSGKDGSSSSILVLPGMKAGSALLYNLTSGSRIILEKLHSHPIAALALSKDGHILATCSEEGKLINLVSIEPRTLQSLSSDKLIIKALRRGNTASHPTCLSFNPDGTLLATASISGTVHVFSNPADEWGKLVETAIKGDCEKETSTWSWITKFVPAPTPYIWKDYIFSCPCEPNTRLICGWGCPKDSKSKNFLVTVETDGSFSSYNITSGTKIGSSKSVEMIVSDGNASGPQMLRGPLPEGSAAPAPAPAPVAEEE